MQVVWQGAAAQPEGKREKRRGIKNKTKLQYWY
jgi:hypothetical protein